MELLRKGCEGYGKDTEDMERFWGHVRDKERILMTYEGRILRICEGYGKDTEGM
jgi:hypothetical protein